MSRRQTVSLFLVLLLLGGILSGCAGAPASQTEPAESADATAETTGVPVTEAPSTAEPTASEPEIPTISWSAAFHDSSLPEGTLTADSAAFLRKNGDGTVDVFNVPLDEVLANRPANPPRSHFFEQYMPQELNDELMPILDYAVVNGCSRFCFPARSVTYSMIRKASRYLNYTYNINDHCRIDPLTVQRFSTEDGDGNFLMITVSGMENGGSVDKYRAGLAAAQAVVDAMPEGLDEQGKMLYLYKYLCDNVRYNYGLYYEWNDASLLYDALVLHSTVCAGYAEGLHVLCALAGIDGFILTGEVDPLGSADDLHAWNVVRINGQYYEFDATWDEGLTPADYVYFGMSEDFVAEHHTRLIRSFEQEVIPPRPENLLPGTPMPEEASDPVYSILWYFRMCNARDSDPKKLFPYFGIDDDELQAGEPKDGWVDTALPMAKFRSLLSYVLTDRQCEEFLGDSFREDADGNVMYRVPEGDPVLLRLVGVEQNPDGSWTASLLAMAPDGSLTPAPDKQVTVTAAGGYWFVDSVE